MGSVWNLMKVRQAVTRSFTASCAPGSHARDMLRDRRLEARIAHTRRPSLPTFRIRLAFVLLFRNRPPDCSAGLHDGSTSGKIIWADFVDPLISPIVKRA
jgi:hypothetical protein